MKVYYFPGYNIIVLVGKKIKNDKCCYHVEFFDDSNARLGKYTIKNFGFYIGKL